MKCHPINNKIIFHISATLKIPDNLPQYQKNAYTIFHQLLTRIDELSVELNVRKMQIGSLFVSIQQVDTERCKPEETIEDYKRRKAIANLTKARYRQQMENLTKQLKKGTALTHNYSMPKPSNEVVLTNPLFKDIPDEITTPNIENNIDDELLKLGISPTLLTTTDSKTNQKGLKRMSTLPSSVCHKTSPSQRTTLEQEKITKETSKTTSKQQDYDEQLPPQSTAQVHKPGQSKQHYQTKKMEATETINRICAKQPEKRTSDESNAEDQPQSSNSMQFPKRTSQAPDVQSLKLSQKEHHQAYPWAHEASKNTFRKTELSSEVEYVNITQNTIGKYFTSRMKDQLKEKINLPDVITEKINNCIGMTEKNDKTTYFCKVCNMKSPYNHPKRVMCARHVRIHLGYSLYRCSFCNFISNNPNCVYSHYTTRHGIPKEWISSEKN